MVSVVTEDTNNLGMWNSNSTKLFLTKYMDYLPRHNRTFSLKTKKKMFEKIASDMAEAGFPFTKLQCQNKWNTVDRLYKKKKQNNKKKTGWGVTVISFYK